MKSSLTADIPCRNEVHTTFRTLIIKTKIRIGRSVLFIEEEYGPELVNTVNVHWWYDILFEFSYWLEKKITQSFRSHSNLVIRNTV